MGLALFFEVVTIHLVGLAMKLAGGDSTTD